MLIDTHAHLNMPEFSDLSEVLARAKDAGIAAIIDVGFDLGSSERSVRLANSTEKVYSAVGIHPHDAESVDDKSFAALEMLAKDDYVVAIGETGLDYYRNLSAKDAQRAAFVRHIKLAKDLGLPMIIHSRESHDDTLRALRENSGDSLTGVMHCFSGDERVAKLVLDLGFYISFAGNVTFPKAAQLREVARFVPADRILSETDCPYLAPEPVRGKRNEPSFIVHSVRALADLKGMSMEEFSERSALNALALFRKLRV